VEKLPDYESINNLLLENRIFMEAAEAHGLLCGLIVCNQEVSVDTWLTVATENPDTWKDLNLDTQNELEELRDVTLTQMRDPDFNFELLIPGEQELLAERAHAVGLWCKGFVTGVEHHGNYLGELMGKAQEEVDEALSDLQSIAEVDYQVKEQKEHKKSLTSVIEYIRIAVLLVQRELSGNFNPPSANTSVH